jgi:hypothetical protein
MKTQLTKNQKYKATLHLGFLESIATNPMVEEKFTAVGFTNVVVTGTGAVRTAIGTWPKENQEAEIPNQITKIEKL